MASTLDKVRHSVTTWETTKKRRLVDDPDLSQDVAAQDTSAKRESGFNRPPLDLQDTLPRIVPGKISLLGRRITSSGGCTQPKWPSCTPGQSQNPLLSLAHPLYELPEKLIANLRSMGISSIYPWQSSCLLGRGNLTGERNLVYTAPTGGGKSLVADVLIMRRVLARQKAMLVLPYVSLVQEKLAWLRKAFTGIERPKPNEAGFRKTFNDDHRCIRVAGFYGGSKTRDTWNDIDVAVCTIEKANSLINAAIEAATLDNLGIVVMDELHMVDDQHRGYIIELLAAKLLSLGQHIQLVGMSATLSDTKLLADWLSAKFYESKYRPIPIKEFLVCEDKIYSLKSQDVSRDARRQSHCRVVEGLITASADLEQSCGRLANSVMALVSETISHGYGVLVFCSSRRGCENTAKLLSQGMPSLKAIDDETSERRREVIEKLGELPAVPLDERLGRIIPYGVAFHHAGITTEERQIVAAGFDSGAIRVITATSGLAAGINLPARRVVLNGVRMGKEIVGPAMLRQMLGRAGRKGKDELGESYICCDKKDLDDVQSLIDADLVPLTSSLTPEKRGIKRALLEVIATRLATQPLAIGDFVSHTLLHHTHGAGTSSKTTESGLQQLEQEQFIRLKENGCYEATLLGYATVVAGFSPEDGLFMLQELQTALQGFVLDTELQLFFIFSPFTTEAVKIEWEAFNDRLDDLDAADLRAMTICGVSPGFIAKQATSGVPLDLTDEVGKGRARTYARFFAAMQLRELCRETPVNMVARRYGVERGSVQGLMLSCQGFAASVIKFCRILGWDMLATLLEHGSERLAAGARSDLLALAKIPFVKSKTARALWENGYKGLAQLAEADVESVAQVLLLAQPRRSKTLGDAEQHCLAKMRERAAIVIEAAGRLWTTEMMAADVEGDM